MAIFINKHIVAMAFAVAVSGVFGERARAQLTDVTQTPNTVNAGIRKSYVAEIGPGRGDVMTPGSSLYLIARDPFRSIVRGRQLFQRKFTMAQGAGPRTLDGVGDIETDGSLGAGLADSCGGCHSRPFGSGGFGGNVFTRPDSRDAPHLFGLGLVEMLGDEITTDLRAIRSRALQWAAVLRREVRLPLVSKGIGYGWITAYADGRVDTSAVEGVDGDLRVRPFFAEGKTISIREFVVGACNAEMGMEAPDPDLLAASQGHDVRTPAGLLLSGSQDFVEAPPAVTEFDDPDTDGVVNEIPVSIVDHFEFYLLNYFKPGIDVGLDGMEQANAGLHVFRSIGCSSCHIQDLVIEHDRRVADVETRRDEQNSNGVFNHLFASAVPRFTVVDDGSGHPELKLPSGGRFLVRNIFADFKRHDLGRNFHERNFDGTITTKFMTEPLWGVASTPPYGHDGRSATLRDVILRHGGEAQVVRDRFASLDAAQQTKLLDFLATLVLFSPPDTASNLEPADRNHPNFPFDGKGSINLSLLFNDPSDKE